MIKKFTIKDIDGNDAQVEYESEIPFGDMEYIINSTLDLTNITRPKVNVAEYRIQLLAKALRKAPFDHKNVSQIRKVPYSVIKQILDELIQDYPLAKYLGDWMSSFEPLKEESKPQSEPTPSVPSNSDGQNEKQTNTQQDSSKN